LEADPNKNEDELEVHKRNSTPGPLKEKIKKIFVKVANEKNVKTFKYKNYKKNKLNKKNEKDNVSKLNNDNISKQHKDDISLKLEKISRASNRVLKREEEPMSPYQQAKEAAICVLNSTYDDINNESLSERNAKKPTGKLNHSNLNLNNSFDINNTRIIPKRTELSKKLEIAEREVLSLNKRNNKIQVDDMKSKIENLEGQQVFSSILMSDPRFLPSVDDFKPISKSKGRK
jgi:hypothetical protein